MLDKYSINKLKGTTLDFTVSLMGEDDILHIGSSTGFIFIGTKGEYYKNVGDISSHWKKFYQDIVKSREKSIMSTVAEITKLKKDYKYRTALEDKLSRLKILYASKMTAEDILKEFKPIQHRKVLDVYPRIQMDGICIIVEGAEQGKYWDREEYLKGEKGK